jgi:hypothetical protein
MLLQVHAGSVWARPVLSVTARSSQVVAIMETFFDVEDGEVENLAPQVCAIPGSPVRGKCGGDSAVLQVLA